ncbi:MAG: response regulator [bacterium]
MDDKIILLVEDNQDDAELVLLSLEESHVKNKVFVVHDGVEALDYLFCTGAHADREPDGLPEVVLLDLKLPKLDGHQVLERIRADPRTRLLPVVVLTSSDLDEDVVRSYEGGANSYVRKPVDFGEFSEAVKRLGLYWVLMNIPPPPAAG